MNHDNWTPLTDDPRDWPPEGKPVLVDKYGSMAVDRWHMINGRRQWTNHLTISYWMELPDRPDPALIARSRRQAEEMGKRFRETMAQNTSGTIKFRRHLPYSTSGDHHDSEKG